MSLPDAEVELTENRQAVLVLRLTLDQDARLLYGELVDAEGVGQERFKTLAALGPSVERWLERQQPHPQPNANRAV